ncbi:MAG: hypothetical protein F7C33_05235, partial [Desulfurococcales archaeon]|nr:hypothetical protein [Desulfurococcales archaeon]
MIKVLLPGLGKPFVTMETLRLQPWNYIVQIAEDLATQGYNVTIHPWPGNLEDNVVKMLSEKGIKVDAGTLNCPPGTLLLAPIGFGYFQKWVSRYEHSINKCRIAGILTTFLTKLSGLLRNYVRIKLSGTAVVADAVLVENFLARFYGRKVLGSLEFIITPSRDYVRFAPGSRVIVYYPRVRGVLRGTPVRGRRGDGVSLVYFGPYTEERGVISIIKSFKIIMNILSGGASLTLLLRDKPKKPIKDYKNINIIMGGLSREELWRRIISSDMVLLPYRIIPSTVPLSFFEALEAEAPLVLASWIPGFREHVSKYLDDGLQEVYSPRDLANYIIKLIENKKYFL